MQIVLKLNTNLLPPWCSFMMFSFPSNHFLINPHNTAHHFSRIQRISQCWRHHVCFYFVSPKIQHDHYQRCFSILLDFFWSYRKETTYHYFLTWILPFCFFLRVQKKWLAVPNNEGTCRITSSFMTRKLLVHCGLVGWAKRADAEFGNRTGEIQRSQQFWVWCF